MKMKTFILFLFVSINYAQIIGPKAIIQNQKYDFGEVVSGNNIEYDFIITNSGGDSLKIIDVRSSCGCTAVMPQKKVLLPNESTSIKAVFNTSGREGMQKKYIYVSTNDTQNPEFRLTISGTIIPKTKASNLNNSYPKLQLSQFQYDFGDVVEGKIVSAKIKLKNSGTGELQIKDIKSTCDCTVADLKNKTLKAGESSDLLVELNTSNRNGKFTRTITVSSNDPNDPDQVITLFANVLVKK